MVLRPSFYDTSLIQVGISHGFIQQGFGLPSAQDRAVRPKTANLTFEELERQAAAESTSSSGLTLNSFSCTLAFYFCLFMNCLRGTSHKSLHQFRTVFATNEGLGEAASRPTRHVGNPRQCVDFPALQHFFIYTHQMSLVLVHCFRHG